MSICGPGSRTSHSHAGFRLISRLASSRTPLGCKSPPRDERSKHVRKWYRKARTMAPVTQAVRSLIHGADTAKPQRVILLPGSRTLRAVASSTQVFLREMQTRCATRDLDELGGSSCSRRRIGRVSSRRMSWIPDSSPSAGPTPLAACIQTARRPTDLSASARIPPTPIAAPIARSSDPAQRSRIRPPST